MFWILFGPFLPSGVGKGSPNRQLVKQIKIQWKNWCPRRGFEKTLVVYWFLMPKWENMLLHVQDVGQKTSKLKPRQTCFQKVFWCWQKTGPKGQQIIFLAASRVARDKTIIQLGPLSSGYGHFGWLYIPLFDTAWHRPVSADFGAHWILKGSQIDRFLTKST